MVISSCLLPKYVFHSWGTTLEVGVCYPPLVVTPVIFAKVLTQACICLPPVYCVHFSPLVCENQQSATGYALDPRVWTENTGVQIGPWLQMSARKSCSATHTWRHADTRYLHASHISRVWLFRAFQDLHHQHFEAFSQHSKAIYRNITLSCSLFSHCGNWEECESLTEAQSKKYRIFLLCFITQTHDGAALWHVRFTNHTLTVSCSHCPTEKKARDWEQKTQRDLLESMTV